MNSAATMHEPRGGDTEQTGATRRPVGSSMLINVDDFSGVTAFYRDVLELPVRKRWDAPAGSGMIFELGPHSTIEFVGPPHAERIDRSPARGIEVMIEVDDAPAWLDRLVSRGVAIQRELVDNPWGDRSFGVDDPSGRRVWIFEALDSPTPAR